MIFGSRVEEMMARIFLAFGRDRPEVDLRLHHSIYGCGCAAAQYTKIIRRLRRLHRFGDRLPVFRTDEIKEIACKALDEVRRSGKFALYAYVIMPDHFHAIIDSARSSEDTLRFINGIVSHRVIAHLKDRGYESSLEKLRQETRSRSDQVEA